MKTRWYKDAIIYQIYPRSFCDSNGDGIGDIKGIISKLDYLKHLGIDAIWLSPCYKSPNDDNGYDISDYRDIMDEFGTLDDWKELISQMHQRNIKLIMDLVANHCSDEHDWFKQSRRSVDNPYRDYFIWRKGRGRNGNKPPNNWKSNFLGSAWTQDEITKEWYLHLFSKKQPDLNWDNPKVRQEIIDICNYWFELGVDGFRCDVIGYISKNRGLPNDKNPFSVLSGKKSYVIGENWEKYIEEINAKSWSNYDSLIVGECAMVNYEQTIAITDESKALLDTSFTFDHMYSDMVGKFNLVKFKKIISKYQTLPKKCWTSVYYENHDQPRSMPRFADDSSLRRESATMLATSYMLQRGTPYIYQGQEIGMTNCNFAEDEYQDIMSINVLKLLNKIRFIKKFGLKKLAQKARDNARTPMQWSAKKNAGFTDGEPWMKINPNHTAINVESDLKDKNSVINHYRKLIKIRKQHIEIIKNGEYKEFFKKNKNIYVFCREYNNEILFVECNFSAQEQRVVIPRELNFDSSKLLLANYPHANNTLITHTLRPFESKCYILLKQ